MKTLVLFIFIAAVSQSQWQNEVRLNSIGTYASTSPNSRSIAVAGGKIHVVYSKLYSFSGYIFYKCSSDEGITWQQEVQLTSEPDEMYGPSIAVSGSYLHVTWQSDNGKIFYKRSQDNGISWDTSVTIVNNNRAYLPAISVTGSFVNVIWNQNDEIYYKRSPDNGLTWNEDVRLTNDGGFSYAPSLYSNGVFVHVTWSDEADGDEEIFYKRSQDHGLNWDESMRLTKSSGYSQWPCVSGNASNVYVVWHDARDLESEIYFKSSTNNGLTWSADRRLTNNGSISWSPTLTVSNSILHIAWMDYREGNFEIFYKRSTDYGKNWYEDTRLTNNSRWSENPAFAVSSTILHMVWDDKREGFNGVYYKRNPTGNKIGLVNLDPVIPLSFTLYQNYPNPFNPETNIKFALPIAGNVKVVVYNSIGEKIISILNEYLDAGTYEAKFNALSLSSGVYFYKLITGTFTDTKKMILLK